MIVSSLLRNLSVDHPLSWSQLYFHREFSLSGGTAPGSALFVSLDNPGNYTERDIGVLVNRLAQRHPNLRTVISDAHGDEPTQRIVEGNISIARTTHDDLRDHVTQVAAMAYHDHSSPATRAVLVGREGSAIPGVITSHVMTDGLGASKLRRDVRTGFAEPVDASLERIVRWQRSAAGTERSARHLGQLSDLLEANQAAVMPADDISRVRTTARLHSRRVHTAVIQCASENRVSPSSVILAAFAVLQRWLYGDIECAVISTLATIASRTVLDSYPTTHPAFCFIPVNATQTSADLLRATSAGSLRAAARSVLHPLDFERVESQLAFARNAKWLRYFHANIHEPPVGPLGPLRLEQVDDLDALSTSPDISDQVHLDVALHALWPGSVLQLHITAEEDRANVAGLLRRLVTVIHLMRKSPEMTIGELLDRSNSQREDGGM